MGVRLDYIAETQIVAPLFPTHNGGKRIYRMSSENIGHYSFGALQFDYPNKITIKSKSPGGETVRSLFLNNLQIGQQRFLHRRTTLKTCNFKVYINNVTSGILI